MNQIQISDSRFSNIEERLEKMKVRAEEFCQTRSNFQIEKFIACDEYTPISKFKHVAHNSYVTMQEIRREMIERERLLRKIKTLEIKQKAHSETFEDADLEIYETSRQLDDLDLRIKGLLKEVNYMEAICDKIEKEEIEKTGTGFSDEKFQAQEPEYWTIRLANQMHQAQIGHQSGVGEGNYGSALMAAEKPILDGSTNEIEPLPIGNMNDIAAIALLPRNGVREKFLVDASQLPEEEREKILGNQ
jgi:hypothetical protein